MDEKQIQRILEYIKIISTPTKSDDEIEFDIIENMERACNYIQNSKFPISCERTLARELVKVYQQEEAGVLGVTSIKEGQTSVNYDKAIDYDLILNNMKIALNPFRRLPLERLMVNEDDKS